MADLFLRLYSLLWWCVLPVALLRLWWRGRTEPGCRTQWGERLARYDRSVPVPAPLLWVHAVSVGETRAAEPLVRALLRNFPGHQVLLTHMTATGRATGEQLFGHDARVHQAYLPYDTLSMTQRFLAHFRPVVCVLMETEVWPSLLASCEQARVPVALVNARLSARSLARGQRFAALIGAAARRIALYAAQTEEDAQRLHALGAGQVSVTGNLKFDLDIPQTMRERGARLRAQFGRRPVLLCASTREGEDSLLHQAYMRATLPPEFLLVIVPRHPQRFEAALSLFESSGLRAVRRSVLGDAPVSDHVQAVIGDTMGELLAYYLASDLAFIGGSLLPLGGQNLIEAAACGKPVLIGPHTFNFQKISEDAVAEGAALRVRDGRELFTLVWELLTEPARMQTMSASASAFAASHRGATDKTLALLAALIHNSSARAG